ncbi:hypothetical protein H4W81_001516 [Nonomuraea africana]|uniref:Uncharacterized protein n=1 Tax=Nonomuraea africana TaxID=46171 RepID=A0ABR9K9Q1_9ACTN|nr:hypothetical protein [Nonomuraea africana]
MDDDRDGLVRIRLRVHGQDRDLALDPRVSARLPA